MNLLRICVSYDATDAAFATRLMTDLRASGAEIITDRALAAVGIAPGADPVLGAEPNSTDLQDTAFEQFLREELPRCQRLVVVQTPEALQSPRVQAIVDTALKYGQQGRMSGVLRVIGPTLNTSEAYYAQWLDAKKSARVRE